MWPISYSDQHRHLPLIILENLLTTTVGTLRDLTIIRKTRVLKTSQVLLDRRGPALAQSRPLRLVAEIEADHVLAVELALKVDQAHAVANRFLL